MKKKYRVIKVTNPGKEPRYQIQVKNWWRWKPARFYYGYEPDPHIYCGLSEEFQCTPEELEKLITIIGVLDVHGEVEKYRGHKIYPVAVFEELEVGEKIMYSFKDINWVFTYNASGRTYLGNYFRDLRELKEAIDQLYFQEDAKKKKIEVVYKR